MSAVAVLTMLVSKVLQKARELFAKLFDTEQIPPKPVMSAEVTAYPKLFKIYKELKRQNEIIFGAGKERNAWDNAPRQIGQNSLFATGGCQKGL